MDVPHDPTGTRSGTVRMPGTGTVAGRAHLTNTDPSASGPLVARVHEIEVLTVD
ncbi:hypothetical protein [Nonomuraea sp. LPB2021202275-12-8]|uniref:hypothetical protein n=1 Tax=Nonomuraea sp. LPB2021202275-12-8 TaxID=3120159 RepID=UPI00300C46DB